MFEKRYTQRELAYGRTRGGDAASVVYSVRRSAFVVAFAVNLLLATILGAEDAHACSCAASTPEEQLQRSDAVFSGEVLEVEEGEKKDTSGGPPLGGPITFEVEESWKGVSKERIVVYGYGQGASCGIEAREGKRYLVYARRGGQGEDALLRTGLCSGTKSLDSPSADKDLRILGPPQWTLEMNTSEETTGGSGGGIRAEELPGSGGYLLLALGAGALLIGGGVVVRRHVRS